MKKFLPIFGILLILSGAGCGSSNGEDQKASYRKVHIWGPVQAYMTDALVDGQAVVCTAKGEYDINMWFSGDADDVNREGVLEAVKQDAKVRVTGYSCVGYNGAKNFCTESLANGPQEFSFDLKQGWENVSLVLNATGNRLQPDRINFSVKEPSNAPLITVSSVCSMGTTSLSDHGASFNQLVFPLTKSSMSFMVGFDASSDPNVLNGQASIGKVLADIELYTQESWTDTLED